MASRRTRQTSPHSGGNVCASIRGRTRQSRDRPDAGHLPCRGRRPLASGAREAQETSPEVPTRRTMTQDNRNHPDLDSAVNAMRNDEPSPEQIRGASARIFHNLQAETPAAQPELIQGCEDIVRLLPAYNAGELSGKRALLVAAHLHDCVSCRQRAEGRATVVQWKAASSLRPTRRWSAFAVAAAMVLFAVIGFY